MRAGDAMAHTGGTSIRIRARKAYTLVTANARSLVDRARRATVGSSALHTRVTLARQPAMAPLTVTLYALSPSSTAQRQVR